MPGLEGALGTVSDPPSPGSPVRCDQRLQFGPRERKLREKNKITRSAQLADGRAGSHRPSDTKAGLFFFLNITLLLRLMSVRWPREKMER